MSETPTKEEIARLWQAVQDAMVYMGLDGISTERAMRVQRYLMSECSASFPFVCRSFTDDELVFALSVIEHDAAEGAEFGYVHAHQRMSMYEMGGPPYADRREVAEQLREYAAEEAGRRDLPNSDDVHDAVAAYLDTMNEYLRNQR